MPMQLIKDIPIPLLSTWEITSIAVLIEIHLPLLSIEHGIRITIPSMKLSIQLDQLYLSSKNKPQLKNYDHPLINQSTL